MERNREDCAPVFTYRNACSVVAYFDLSASDRGLGRWRGGGGLHLLAMPPADFVNFFEICVL